MRWFRMAASVVGFVCLGIGQVHGAPMILQAGEVLEVRFDLPAAPEPTADYLSFGIDTVDVVEAFTSRTARLYDGTTLLAEHAPADPFGDYVGPLMMGGAFGWKAPQSLWTWGLPPAIDFSTILDGTIQGRIEMRIASGRIAFDPNDVHVRLLHAQGDNWGTDIDPVPRIASVAVVPETGPVLTAPNGGEIVRVGQVLEILWYGGAPADPVDIEYSTNDGRTWSAVDTVANTGRFEWTVPPVVSAQCRIRLRQADAFDTSDAAFVVYQCQQNVGGDLNGDCRVNLQDLALFAAGWLAPGVARVHSEPLDDDPGWTTEGQWAFGPPQGTGGTAFGHPDPAAGATGQNVYGVNLDGDYVVTVDDPMHLTTGPFDCRHFTDLRLRFRRFLNTDTPDYTVCRVEFSLDGVEWTPLWTNADSVTDDQWTTVEYPLGPAADRQAQVFVRWSYQIVSGRAYPASGWNIDDIELVGQPW